MDAINPTMSTMDIAIVIRANDVVNPAAREVKSSPIYGMPIIKVDEARTVFVLKRSMASGFAGIENPLFLNRTPGCSSATPKPACRCWLLSSKRANERTPLRSRGDAVKTVTSTCATPVVLARDGSIRNVKCDT
jgi:hypothetical protein